MRDFEITVEIDASPAAAWAVLALAAVPFLLSGCLETTVQVSSSGSYQLTSYDGQSLPYQTRPASCLIELENGALLLFTDGTFELDLTAHSDGTGCVSEAAKTFPPKLEGTYVHDSFNIQFTHPDGSTTAGFFQGNGVGWFVMGAQLEFSRS